MSESKLQAKIIKYLESLGYLTCKVVLANKSGIPDIIACSPTGRHVEIEVKFGRNTLSALQEYRLNEVNKKGGVGIAAWSLEDVVNGLSKASLIH